MGMIGIIGGSFAGLFAARALARKGHRVTVFEPDDAGGTEDLDRTFHDWVRPGVPQLRQPHSIRALSRKLLRERDPELAEALVRDSGALEWPYFLRRPGSEEVRDPDLVGIMARRTSFEPVIRKQVEKTPGVTFVKAAVDGLLLDAGPDPKVRGVRLRDGSEHLFACVIDASGRRTRVPQWLQAAGIEPPGQTSLPAGMIYYNRYFRFRPGVAIPEATGIRSGPAGVLPLLAFRSNRLDRDTFSLTLAVASWEARFRVLKNDAVFNAFAGSIKPVAAWIDPAVSEPISKVGAFGAIFNTCYEHLRDGRPIVANFYALGDARVHTSPYFGWGITLALKQAYLLADGFEGPDNEPAQIAFEKAAAEFCRPYFEAAAEEDIARTALWQGEPVPENNRYGEYIETITPAAGRDPHVYRAVYRRTNMLDRPDAIFGQTDIVDRARQVMRSVPPQTLTPKDVIDLLDGAEMAASSQAAE
jgi:2-polyprenyl-6-methoxyphenol hydroxylase-like FAD-dependent oxidoreductase